MQFPKLTHEVDPTEQTTVRSIQTTRRSPISPGSPTGRIVGTETFSLPVVSIV